MLYRPLAGPSEGRVALHGPPEAPPTPTPPHTHIEHIPSLLYLFIITTIYVHVQSLLTKERKWQWYSRKTDNNTPKIQ